MRFPQAVRNSGLGSHLRQGIQAVRNRDRGRIRAGRNVTGSVDLDAALAGARPDEHRWDYLIGRSLDPRSDHLHCVEVHRADVNQVDAMIAKKIALDAFLRDTALGALPKTCHWVATDGGVYLPKNTPEARKLLAKGLEFPRKSLDLD